MIRNDQQLAQAYKSAEKLRQEIEELYDRYSGMMVNSLVQPLREDLHRLERDMGEYQELRNTTLQDTIEGILSEPVLLGNISELLTKLRLASGMTQEELADRLGWHQPNLSRFESKTTASHTIAKILEYASEFGVWLKIFPSLDEYDTKIRYVHDHEPELVVLGMMQMSEAGSQLESPMIFDDAFGIGPSYISVKAPKRSKMILDGSNILFGDQPTIDDFGPTGTISNMTLTTSGRKRLKFGHVTYDTNAGLDIGKWPTDESETDKFSKMGQISIVVSE